MEPRFDADSPISGEETAEEAFAPSPKKSRRRALKKVVTVPINGGDAFRRKGEAYPPSDEWSWRKYGQKPIKGSPYPRGYYRCSSSKGCPARKQVERSRHDPTAVLITYSGDHNHLPVHRSKSPASSGADDDLIPQPSSVPEEEELRAEPAFVELAGEFGWLCCVGSTVMDGGACLVGPMVRADVEAVFMPEGEEDDRVFGDLGDLPESAVVLRWRRGPETP